MFVNQDFNVDVSFKLKVVVINSLKFTLYLNLLFFRIWQTTDKRESPVANRVVLRSPIHPLHRANRPIDEYSKTNIKFWERAKARQTKLVHKGFKQSWLEIKSVYRPQFRAVMTLLRSFSSFWTFNCAR